MEILDPVSAEQREAVRVEREHRLAMRNRHLTFSYDHHGSVEFKGSLPVAEAEPFIKIIDSYTAQAKRGIDRLDPNTEPVTPAMRRADALLAMVNRHCAGCVGAGPWWGSAPDRDHHDLPAAPGTAAKVPAFSAVVSGSMPAPPAGCCVTPT